MENLRLKKRKKAIEILNDLYSNSSHALIIHYSCESFYDISEGRTPRVTSIAVMYMKSAQTKSFSIHKVAERKRVDFDKIENHYDELEKEMLAEFFSFLKKHITYRWVHWNMRDINYGFEAIENRYAVLCGRPESISDENKFDLSRILIDKYGTNYIGHPRLEQLIEKNNITKKEYLPGREEAQAFKDKQYIKLHQSTLRKVQIINNILDRAAEGSLKTDSNIWEVYGISPQGVFDLIKDNWVASSIVGVLCFVIGLVTNILLK